MQGYPQILACFQHVYVIRYTCLSCRYVKVNNGTIVNNFELISKMLSFLLLFPEKNIDAQHTFIF